MAVSIQAVRVKNPDVMNTYQRRMVVVVLATIITLGLVWDAVLPIVQTNLVVNGLIGAVFLMGVLTCFRNLYRLKCDLTVLHDLDSLLFEHQDVSVLHSYNKKMFITTELFLSLEKSAEVVGCVSQILPSVARSLFNVAETRLGERRLRMGYFINLLIHLGLLGTFIGLAITVGSIHGLTSNLAAGLSGDEDLTRMLVILIQQLDEPLSGMGTAFSTSLMGLSSSIVLGAMVMSLNKASVLFINTYSNWLFEFAIQSGESNGPVKDNDPSLFNSPVCPAFDHKDGSKAVLEKMHEELQRLGEINASQLAALKQMEERAESSQLRQVEALQDIYQEMQRQDAGRRLDEGVAAVLAAVAEQGEAVAGLAASVVGELEKQSQSRLEQGGVMANLTTDLKTGVVGALERQNQILTGQSTFQESSHALATSQREQLLAGQKAAQQCREQANNTLGSLNHRVGKLPENTVPIVREAIEQSASSLEVSLLRRIRLMMKRYQRFWLRLLRIERVKQQETVEALSETMHAEQVEHRQAVEKQVAGEGEKQRALLARLFKALHRIYRLLLRKLF